MTTPAAPPDGIRHETGPDGILRVVFDRPGGKVNLLTREILEHLGRLIEESRGDERVKALLFLSEKPGSFLAGADIDELAAVKDAWDAVQASRLGQTVLQKIADAPWPSACAIGGVCLGGGTELALSCTYRIAADGPAVKIGLPEIRLGIVPGFGGTQRLPRVVGLVHALDLILTGRSVDARRAERIGLVDRIVPAPKLEQETREALRAAVAGRRPFLRSRRPLAVLAVEGIPPLRSRVISNTRRRTAARISPADYPAPFRALEAIEAAFSQPLPQGLDLEARILGELLPTRTSRNLVWLFRSRAELRRGAGGFQATPRKIRKVFVLGAGAVGAGVAHLVADREIPVRIRDLGWEPLLGSLRTARRIWSEEVARGGLSPHDAASRMAFLSPGVGLEGLARADLVVEAVVEDLAVKQEALAEAEERIGERAIFATGTSTLPVTEIASRALRPERVVGLHFFHPPHRMPLVEIVAGQRTSPEAVVTAHAFALALGKTPVVVRDSPGFLVNRIVMLYVGEAMRLLVEGFRVDAVDAAMRAFGMPVGPFELLDGMGLDSAAQAARILEAAFGKRIGAPAAVLGALVESGRLGVKGGAGFYRYRDGRRAAADARVPGLVGAARPGELPGETLQERMALSMINEAAICLEDGVAREPRDVDVAMVLGAGFPASRGGPLRWADAIGLPTVVDRLSRLADAHGERFRPASLLRDSARDGRPLHAQP